MKDFKFVHSFSTRPLRIDCYGIDGMQRLMMQVWYFSLSVAYLKRIGAKVVLHTDSFGKAVLGHLPYDEISLTLDDWPEGIHPRFWAAGKFVALEAETGPCVHIDGDVFIKRPSLHEMIGGLLCENDLIVQCLDPAVMYNCELPIFEKEKEYCQTHGIVFDGKDAYNTGLLGFSSDETRHQLCRNYLELVRHLSKTLAKELDASVYATPDLVVEQKMTESFSRLHGWKVARLLNDPAEAVAIGYQHVYTVDKLNQIGFCMESLKGVDEDIYEDTLRLCGIMETPKSKHQKLKKNEDTN